MHERVRERLASLPPSAKLVHYVLVENGRLDQTGLAEESRLSTRTVRFAIEKLSGAGLVEEGVCPTDARRAVYRSIPDPVTKVTTDSKAEPGAESGAESATESGAESATESGAGTEPASRTEQGAVPAED